MDLEKPIRDIVENECTGDLKGLHSRIQNRLFKLGADKKFFAYKEYYHINPFQNNAGSVDVFWDSKRISYAIEIDRRLKKESLQKLISLQSIAQPVWVLITPDTQESQERFLKENDHYGFVHVISIPPPKPNITNEDFGKHDFDIPSEQIINDESIKLIKTAITNAETWDQFESNLAKIRCGIQPRGGGFALMVNSTTIKASALGREYGFNYLCKKLGLPPEHLHPKGYTTALGKPTKRGS